MHDPRVPETLEGWSLLHQMFRVRWPDWRALAAARATAARGRRPRRLAAMNRGRRERRAP